MAWRDWLKGLRVDPGEVRAEIWWLGARYQGEPLEGARTELQAAGLSVERAALLRACVTQLEAGPARFR
jgi:hypothetical protein